MKGLEKSRKHQIALLCTLGSCVVAVVMVLVAKGLGFEGTSAAFFGVGCGAYSAYLGGKNIEGIAREDAGKKS